jgi:hypothetical protein
VISCLLHKAVLNHEVSHMISYIFWQPSLISQLSLQTSAPDIIRTIKQGEWNGWACSTDELYKIHTEFITNNNRRNESTVLLSSLLFIPQVIQSMENYGGIISAGKFTVKMKTSFWDLGPCSLAEIYRRFGGANCLHWSYNDENITHLLEVGVIRDYTMLYIRRLSLYTRRRENLKPHLKWRSYFVVKCTGLITVRANLVVCYLSRNILAWIWFISC